MPPLSARSENLPDISSCLGENVPLPILTPMIEVLTTPVAASDQGGKTTPWSVWGPKRLYRIQHDFQIDPQRVRSITAFTPHVREERTATGDFEVRQAPDILAQFYHSMTPAEPRLYAISAQNDIWRVRNITFLCYHLGQNPERLRFVAERNALIVHAWMHEWQIAGFVSEKQVPGRGSTLMFTLPLWTDGLRLYVPHRTYFAGQFHFAGVTEELDEQPPRSWWNRGSATPHSVHSPLHAHYWDPAKD